MESKPHQEIKLPWTGERVVPETPGTEELFLFHWARYSFAVASSPPAGRILDLGCGTGYGTHLLARTYPDSHVVGIDISADAIAYAAYHYQLPNLQYTVGNAFSCPFPKDSFDAIVSFEVFEHLEAPLQILDLVRWLLKPNGVFIVSTPNRDVYSAGNATPWNPYHTQEFSSSEFEKVLRTHFPHTRIYGQQHAIGSLIWKDEHLADIDSQLELAKNCPLSQAAYLIAVCASCELPPPQPPQLWLMGVQDLDGIQKAHQAHVEKLAADIAHLSKALQGLQAYQDRVESHTVVRIWRYLQKAYAKLARSDTKSPL